MKITNILFIVIAFLMFSCSIMKKADKAKINRELTETTETITKRIGDTVRYEVPNVKFKDTTITIKNYVTGTTQKLYYDNKGQLTAAECLAGFYEKIERNNKILIEAIKEKQSEKKEQIPASIIIYGFIGLALLIVICVAALYFILKKQLPGLIK